MSKATKSSAPAKNAHRKSILIFGIASLAALVVCMAVVLGVSFSMITEGVYEFDSPGYESLTPQPQGQEKITAFLTELIAGSTDDSTIFVNTSVSAEVSTQNIEFDGTSAERNALLYMKDSIMSKINSFYPDDYEGHFNDGFKAYPFLYLNNSDISEATCTQGRNNDAGEYENGDSYFFELTVPGGSYPAKQDSAVYKTFRLGGSEKLLSEIKNELSSAVKVVSFEAVPQDFQISAESNRLTDEMTAITFLRNYRIRLTLEFLDEFASLGQKTIGFDYSVKEEYKYTKAGICFVEDSMNLLEGESLAPAVEVVMNKEDECKITFESSDPTVATVDETGYVTGVKCSKEPVTLTVNFEYLGHKYSDSCTVTVTVPVEKIKISCDEMEIFPGNTAKLYATVKPKDATISDVLWRSEDDSIAYVEPDGTIIAVSKGTVKIIAISADGYFRDSCTVTVYG